ncbi:nuclear transport factor 2 family protein [Kordiimonas sp. SCSIO 12603]|uniref:nuclear transport factor 2 family protein n=1 Tax=Kordiimonas sp. SCSIO 12603 TaxID=2829596 RepID=UPI0021049AAD|nr:nuclear transport factor 2 family protein [Kordiimonas sp. SCSIO 12603]UTW57412.1 nuclear transport factor 2 family protein [Kordiimonas sp. SCSIO 12603]
MNFHSPRKKNLLHKWQSKAAATALAMALNVVPAIGTDTDAEIIAQEALEQKNLEKAVYCMKVLEVDLDVDRFGRECVADVHIEHAPHVPDGKEGLLQYFARALERMPQMHGDIKRAGADGDLVWMHIHFKPTPSSTGNAGMHIFRMEDGKFAEHWGVSRPVVKSELHDNSPF